MGQLQLITRGCHTVNSRYFVHYHNEGIFDLAPCGDVVVSATAQFAEPD